MKKVSKLFSLVLIISLLFSLAGCGGNNTDDSSGSTTAAATTTEATNAEATNTADNGIDISKPVKLTGYLLGDRPAGMDDVLTEINKKLTTDINATMEINYIGWGDLDSKYPLVLASGENIDWIYTANWCKYAQESTKGSFLELSEDLLKKYMPKHYENCDPIAYSQSMVNGKFYMVTSSSSDSILKVVLIREDLRKKYGVAEINKITELDSYFEAIKKNEPSMIPFNGDNNYDLNLMMLNMLPQYGDVLGNSGLYYDWQSPEPKVLKVTDEPFANDYKNAATQLKTWYDKGFINKDIFASKVSSKDNFVQGKSATAFANLTNCHDFVNKAAENGWEIKVIPVLTPNGKVSSSPYTSNGVAIAAKSPNPERTMMALDLLMEDESYVNLDYLGIEGKNYVVKDGKIALPDGVTTETNPYPVDAAGFWFINKNLLKPFESKPDQVIKLYEDVKGYTINPGMDNWVPDISNIKTEVANLQQVSTQYQNPIFVGAIKDVNDAIKTLADKQNAAGVDKVVAELQKQMDASK